MLELMIDGPDSQFTLQRAKDTLDLRELHIARPQHRWIFSGEIAPQQIVAIPLCSAFQLRLVDRKRERLPRDRLSRLVNLNLHEPYSPAGLFLGGADAQQQPTALSQALAHHAQLA